MGIAVDGSVQEALDHFAALSDVRIALFSPEGSEVSVGAAKRGICRYCRALRDDPSFDERCRQLDADKRVEARRLGRTITYRCHAGLVESVTPLTIDRHDAGYLMIGQIRSADVEPTGLWDSVAGEGSPEPRRLFHSLPALSAGRLHHVLGMFEVVCGYVCSAGLVRMVAPSRAHRIMAWIDDHPSIEFNLSEAARMVGCSVSTLAHEFQSTFGLSPKQAHIERRLREAERLFREDPDSTVASVAYRLGYADPQYFSRQFRRHRGRAPSEARRIEGCLGRASECSPPSAQSPRSAPCESSPASPIRRSTQKG